MASTQIEEVFLTQPNPARVGPSPYTIDITNINVTNLNATNVIIGSVSATSASIGTLSANTITSIAGDLQISSTTANINFSGKTFTNIGGGVVTSVTAGGGITIGGTAINPTVTITATGVTANTYISPTITINARGQITAVVPAVTTLLTADWMQTAQTIGGASTTNFTAGSLDGTYFNLLAPALNAGTGVYTATQAGVHSASVTGINVSIPGPCYVFISKTDGLAVNKTIAIGQIGAGGGTASCLTYLNVGDSIVAGINNGGAGGDIIPHVSFTFIGS